MRVVQTYVCSFRIVVVELVGEVNLGKHEWFAQFLHGRLVVSDQLDRFAKIWLPSKLALELSGGGD